MDISETAPLKSHQTSSYDLDLPTAINDGERRDLEDDNDSDTSYPESVEEGLRPTNVTESILSTKEPKAWHTILGMCLVAFGTALFCTNGAIVQKHGGSILQLMLGRYCVQNIISSILWVFNPWNVRKDSIHWYGDGPSRKIIWLRGLALFSTVFFWWRGLELVPLGL